MGAAPKSCAVREIFDAILERLHPPPCYLAKSNFAGGYMHENAAINLLSFQWSMRGRGT
jgi:hypothetical protein